MAGESTRQLAGCEVPEVPMQLGMDVEGVGQ